MTKKDQILTIFNALRDEQTNTEAAEDPRAGIFLPDLNIWYNWHSKQGTLPEELAGMNLEDACRALGVPVWNTCRPWKIESTLVEVSHFREEGKRITQYKYGEKALRAVWSKGPDGDWWQTEYPVKTVGDLEVVKAFIEGRTFKVQPEELRAMLKRTGDDGIVVPQLPPRAFSWLMLEILGWSEGLMVLMDGEKEIGELVTQAEAQIQDFTRTMAGGLQKEGIQIYLSPDNLDGMFISPRYFEDYLSGGYQASSGILHEYDSFLMVHGGGPLGRILEQASQCGIDCMAGICGPPQGDTPLKTAREKTGNGMILWGGIPQDYLMENIPYDEFETKTRELTAAFRGDKLSIVGIADHVSIDTSFPRLKKTIQILRNASG